MNKKSEWWWLVLVPVVLVAVLLFNVRPAGTLLEPGSPTPPIMAADWLNGTPAAEADRLGHVVVIDVWASW